MKKSDKNYKYRDILTATDCAIVESKNLLYKSSMKTQKNKTFNVCYLREYIDPENECQTFDAYETIYRNVPEKYRSKFDTKEMKMKILKFCTNKDRQLTILINLELNLLTKINTTLLTMMCLETCDNEKIKKECLMTMVM